MSRITLKAESIAKRFGKNAVLEGVDLQARGGEVLGIIGHNGAGKSTLLRILCGSLVQDAGTVSLDGRILDASARKVATAMLFGGNPALYPELTGRQNVAYFGALRGMAADALAERIAVLAERFGTASYLDSRASTLSTGMAQRIALMRAVVHDPQVLLLDEPEAGLDFEAARVVSGFISDSAAEGKAVVVSSHSAEIVAHACDRVAVIAHGRIAELLTTEELAARGEARDVLYRLVEEA